MYIIKNIKNKMYYKNMFDKQFHFVSYICECKHFKYKKDVLKVFNKMINLKEFKNIVIEKVSD